ncbi:MAG: Crp/Fnr family transcriptional regulator [Polyangiaceae bacterium]|nr:Crp/Fnr family transcriptional regulator [Polyangiaceae bacterium]
MDVSPDTEQEPAAVVDPLHARFGQRFEAGDTLFSEGDPATHAYLLEEGRVRLIKRIRGAERSILVCKPGDLFGESALLEGSERSSTAVALSPVLALVIDQATLQHLLEHNATIASRVVKQLVRRLRDAEHQLEVTMHTDIQSKVVRALLEHARRAREPGSGGATFSISPMELAAQVGLDVDTLKRNVQKLRDGQYVRIVDERLEIPSIEGLRKYFGLLGQRDELAAEVPEAR